MGSDSHRTNIAADQTSIQCVRSRDTMVYGNRGRDIKSDVHGNSYWSVATCCKTEVICNDEDYTGKVTEDLLFNGTMN